MDDADSSDLTQEQHLQRALSRRYASLPAIGQCYSCGESVDGGSRRFCDRDCMDDYERAERARRMNGGME